MMIMFGRLAFFESTLHKTNKISKTLKINMAPDVSAIIFELIPYDGTTSHL